MSGAARLAAMISRSVLVTTVVLLAGALGLACLELMGSQRELGRLQTSHSLDRSSYASARALQNLLVDDAGGSLLLAALSPTKAKAAPEAANRTAARAGSMPPGQSPTARGKQAGAAPDPGMEYYGEDEIPDPKGNAYGEPIIDVRIQTKDTSSRDPPPYYNFEKCRRLLTVEERTRTLHEPIWVHFPKCGTSFGILLHNHGCVSQAPRSQLAEAVQDGCICGELQHWDITITQGRFVPWHLDQFCTPEVELRSGRYRGHDPIWAGDFYHRFRGKFVTTFRDPRRRLVSAYNDQKHSYGLPVRLTQALHDIDNLRDYVELPGIAGCMTKMVLGHHCAAVVGLGEADLLEAKRRLRDYAFIGLVEYWSDSVCLFNAMFGGKVRPNTMFNSRSATGYYKQEVGQTMRGNRAGPARYIPSDSWKQLKPEDDPMDWELYQEAKQIFFRNLRLHGLFPVPAPAPGPAGQQAS